ncbi:hypothetical protein PRIPAC_79123 [Pristionchus pacificus]|uniref:Phosphotransferase n=1 Tax=Pristionchus pacificus TaxID=54126 RepID=A0A2A6C3K1_PRIPA|nr:hypothetical protein PRIPAC_79123 [Pristionchus pacificus]|eukprot:PDM72710.1 phosphotransferase [Pristionchus pacificus]
MNSIVKCLVVLYFFSRALGKLQAESTKNEMVSESIKTKDIFAEFTKSKPKESVEAVESVMGDYYGATLPSTIHKQLGLTPVFINGDLRTENVLVDKDTGDLRALIDWQCTHLGVGVEDLLRISFFAQSSEDRRATAEQLIEEMYNAFVANLGGLSAPYSLTQPHKPQSGDDEEKQRRYEVVVDKARGVLEDIVIYHEKNKTSKHNVAWNYAAA